MNVVRRSTEKIYIRYLDALSKRPFKKVVVLIQACNLDCPMCSMNVNNSEVPQVLRDYPDATKGPQLKLDEYVSFFDQVKRYRPAVSIAGGEPFAFKQMSELVSYVSNDCGLSVGVTSNGTMFSDEKLEKFGQSGAGITLSLDGLKETHDRIRGEGNFDKTVEVMRRVVAMKREGVFRGGVSSLSVFYGPTFEEAPELADFLLRDVGIDRHTFSFLIFSTEDTLQEHEKWVTERGLPDHYRINIPRGGHQERTELASQDFDEMWRIKRDILERHENVVFQPDFKSREDLETYFSTDDLLPRYFAKSCNPSTASLTLVSNGDVLFFPGCFEIKCGNIRESTVDEIWNSATYQGLRDTLAENLSPVCSHCCANRIEKEM